MEVIGLIRYAMEKLIEWKNRPNRKPLIIKGARQVGKTCQWYESGKSPYGMEFYSDTTCQGK